MTEEPQSALSNFTMVFVPKDWPVDAEARTKIIQALIDAHAEQIDRGVRITLAGHHRGDAMMSALELWKENIGPIGDGEVGVHLELIDGEPLPKTFPPIRFGPIPVSVGPDAGVIWLRFMPDYEAAPALWYLDPDNLDGVDHGLASIDAISPALNTEIEGWIAEWQEWHDCDVEDPTPPDPWLKSGERILQALRDVLEPLGYRIAPRMI